jgi:LacI family transcriptional regulator
VKRRATIFDVAREAGVSPQTVSRAINDKGEITEETRLRVLDVAHRLEFRPSAIARSLATNRTTAIGLVVPDIANPFFSGIARGVEDIAYSSGYSVFVCNTDEDHHREISALDSLLERQVDGVILCSSRLPEMDLDKVVRAFRSAVLVNRTLGGNQKAICTVLVDDSRGAQVAVAHLIERGRRRIAFLAGPERSWSGRKRLHGLEEALKNHGLPIDRGLIAHCEPETEDGRKAALHLLGLHPDVDSLLAFNDLVAVGALQACQELGREVPQSVAIVGCDDIPLASLVTPPLTTLRIPTREIGEAAMRSLIATIHEDQPEATQITLTPELVVRSSAP